MALFCRYTTETIRYVSILASLYLSKSILLPFYMYTVFVIVFLTYEALGLLLFNIFCLHLIYWAKRKTIDFVQRQIAALTRAQEQQLLGESWHGSAL